MNNIDTPAGDIVNLPFLMNQEDEWPPISIENLPCIKTDAGFRLIKAPLFIKNLSVNDEISVVLNEVGHVISWEFFKLSKRSTIWLLRLQVQGDLKSIFKTLHKLKCNTTSLEQYGCYSIDVPEDCSTHDLDNCLSLIDKSCFAIAYPSFRHED